MLETHKRLEKLQERFRKVDKLHIFFGACGNHAYLSEFLDSINEIERRALSQLMTEKDVGEIRFLQGKLDAIRTFRNLPRLTERERVKLLKDTQELEQTNAR